MSAHKTGRGRTAGHPHRRGTVLLMVVGVLALMSIVAVVYVTIGQSDRRGAAALVREQRLDDQSRAVADYLSGIIADDVVAVKQVTDPSGLTLYMRESWDAPTFDNTKLSQTTDPARRFDPVGQGTDPWLADHGPTWLRFDRSRNARDTTGVRRYLNNLDWGQISDPWPDGRFVNLGNLRGNFNVEPGIGVDADGRPRTSWGLTLFLDTIDQPIQRVGTPANEITNIRLDSRLANRDYNVPAHMATRQANAFRPIRDVERRVTAPSAGVLNMPFITFGVPEWFPNQWADCDGDGIADARWADGTDTSASTATASRPRSLLRGDGSMRFFVATRIIDLSGLINVNTAGDLYAELPADYTGDNRFPLGLTPGDVDLRALLSLQTRHDMLGDGETYALFQQPEVTPELPSDYSDAFQGTPFDAEAARNSAFAGYSALRQALATGQLSSGPVDVTTGGAVLGRAAKYDLYQRMVRGAEGARFVSTGGAAFESSMQFGLADQAELLTYFGVNDPDVTSTLESTLDGRWDNGSPGSPESRFGPLRSGRPLSVERDGVGDFLPGPPDQTAPHVLNDGLADDDALLQAETDRRRLLTTISGARPIIASPVSGPGAPLTESEVAPDVYSLLENSSGNPTTEGVDKIFRAYADALLPWSDADFPQLGSALAQPPWVIEANAYTNAKPDRARTLSYGHRGPELPLWMAAFMAVNLKDAHDDDDNPTSFTLLIDRDYQQNATQWPSRFPAPGGAVTRLPNRLSETPPGMTSSPFWPAAEGRLLDLAALTGNNDRLANTEPGVNHPPLNDPENGRPLAAPAVNIFGLEAQPFVTQVALISCFTDTPNSAGGDDDEEDWTDPNGNLARDPGEITQVSIRGDVADGNADFLFQVFAVQIHNPFEETITLGSTQRPYVVQFGRSRFEFVDGASLASKATKVFYCVTPGRSVVNPRLASRWTGTGTAITIDSWLINQLGLDNSEVTQNELVRYDVDSAQGSPEVGETSALNMLDPDPEANRAVLLWRTENDASGTLRRILVDRMRDPELTGTPSLDRTFDLPDLDGGISSSNPDDIAGTDTSSGPDGGGGDNTGYSLITFGSFRRPDDPGAGGTGIPLGAIPAFCVERRGFGVTAGTRPLNIGPDDDSSLRDGFTDLDGMSKADFVGALGGSTPGKTTLSDLLSPQATAGGDVVLPSIKENPRSRTGNTIPNNLANVAFQNRYVEAFLPNNRFRVPGTNPPARSLRPTDLLLPWAIGSWELPGSSGLDAWRSERRARIAPTDSPLEWATVSEMLAMALDYEAPAAGRKDLFFDQTTTPEWRSGQQAYDRACLRVNAFVPFVDSNNDRIYGYVVPATTPATTELIVPPGVTFAASVVDRLRVHEFGSITRAVPGLINVNTAPIDVLRALPGLTPPSPALDVGTATWFWTGTQDSLSDIGATLLAYRDNAQTWPRDIGAGGVSTRDVNFRMDNNPAASSPNGRGRRLKTGIQGLRQPALIGTGAQAEGAAKVDRSENGFRSIGETMLARDLTIDPPPAGGGPAPGVYPYSIDRLAFDRKNVGGDPGDPVVYIADSTVYDSGGTKKPNEIVDDYQEQFALSGAIMNSISVRSDVFAVWFILRGYTVGDVEGLELQEPMVPSVERRFLMIVDRSNVTQRGQKPRVLLFKELPM
jgi:hypothetical protein